MTFLSEGERAKNKNRDWFHFWTQYTDNDDTWKKVLIKSWHTAHRIIMLGRSIFNIKSYWAELQNTITNLTPNKSILGKTNFSVINLSATYSSVAWHEKTYSMNRQLKYWILLCKKQIRSKRGYRITFHAKYLSCSCKIWYTWNMS